MTGGAMFRWGRQFAGLLIWFVLVVPVGVVVATKIGMQPTHWSGARLVDVDLPLLTSHPGAAPEPANVLWSHSRDQDETDNGDLAPSYWDAGASQIVLGAVTDAGAATRQRLGEASGVAFRVERFQHSSRELQHIMDDVLPRAADGAIQSGIDAEHNRVRLTVTRLSHSLFTDLAARYGDAIEVQLAPFAEPATELIEIIGAPDAPTQTQSWYSRADPWRTWYVLTTGFPWFMGAALIFAIVVWVLVRVRRLDGELPPSPHRVPAAPIPSAGPTPSAGAAWSADPTPSAGTARSGGGTPSGATESAAPASSPESVPSPETAPPPESNGPTGVDPDRPT